jgi:tellurite resistance protein
MIQSQVSHTMFPVGIFTILSDRIEKEDFLQAEGGKCLTNARYTSYDGDCRDSLRKYMIMRYWKETYPGVEVSYDEVLKKMDEKLQGQQDDTFYIKWNDDNLSI